MIKIDYPIKGNYLCQCVSFNSEGIFNLNSIEVLAYSETDAITSAMLQFAADQLTREDKGLERLQLHDMNAVKLRWK